MKIPKDSVIGERKIKEYLLAQRSEDDKSGFLALAGYTLANWRQLEADLRRQVQEADAVLIRTTQYGDTGSACRPEWKGVKHHYFLDPSSRDRGNAICDIDPRQRGERMRIDLFKRVALRIDVPEHGLRKGDVATIVEHLPGKDGEDGYALEVFNAIGESIAVITVPESAVEALTADRIPSVRPLARTA